MLILIEPSAAGIWVAACRPINQIAQPVQIAVFVCWRRRAEEPAVWRCVLGRTGHSAVCLSGQCTRLELYSNAALIQKRRGIGRSAGRAGRPASFGCEGIHGFHQRERLRGLRRQIVRWHRSFWTLQVCR